MKNVYLETKINNNISFEGGKDCEYYLGLILNEIILRLNCNGINYSEENSSLDETLKLIFEMDCTLNQESPGIKIFFQNSNAQSHRLSNIIFNNIKNIYYEPSNVKFSDVFLPENLNSTFSKIVFESPQNSENLVWIRQNIENIATEIVISLTEFFGIPFVSNCEKKTGIAKQNITLRERPNLNSKVVGSIEPSTKVNVLGQWEDWYIVDKNGNLGYSQTKFIEI